MRKKVLIALLSVLSILSLVSFATAQKKAKAGRVCGDPTAECKGGSDFQPFDLPFEIGSNNVIFESERFYGIVLKSVKMKDWGNCEKPLFPESERLAIQEMFPHNKVFALNCFETGLNYYTGVAQKTAFIGVYAGRTLAEANKFLKTVRATGKFAGVSVRQLKIGVNGT
ncbi:MAG: hypothetical protein K1X36_01345 [Pyrinomonadaceae bacterium]|nr:hypothetical protein [Pyrinomonadaceae bacterium]